MRSASLDKRVIKGTVVAITGYFSTCGILAITPQPITEFFSSNSLFSIVLFAVICKIFFHTKISNKRRIAVCAIFATLLCFSIVIGYNLQLTGWPDKPGYSGLGEWAAYFKVLALIPLAVALASYLFGVIERILASRRTSSPRFTKRQYFFVSWLIIFGCWLPWLLVSFPGVYGYDSAYQVAQVVNDGTPLTTHHPPLHTFLLGGSVLVGLNVFGSEIVGLAIYSVAQMLVMSSICSSCCCILRFDLKLDRWIPLLALSFFGLFPLCAIFSMSATKDVLFAGSVLALSCMLVKASITKGRVFLSPRYVIAMTVCMIASLLLRNNMLPAVLLSAPLLLVIFRKRMKVIAASILVAICVGLATTNIIYPLAGIEQGGLKGEMYSVPLSQLARVVNNEDASITSDEELWIKATVPLWELYDARIADNAKAAFDKEEFEENLLYNVKMYLEIGIKNPGEYTNQFLDMTAGYWFPGKVFRDKAAFHPYILWDETYGLGLDVPEDREDFEWIERSSLFPGADEEVSEWIYNCDWQQIPVVSLFFSPGFVLWCWLFALAFVVYRRKYALLAPLLIPLAIVLTCMLGPLVQPRYVYILFLALPLVIGILLYRDDDGFRPDAEKEVVL